MDSKNRLLILLRCSLIILFILMFCANPTNPNDPTLPGYNPTSVNLNIGSFSGNDTDTVRNNYTTDSKITIEFSSQKMSRIDTIFIDKNSADGSDLPIVLVLDTMSSKWIDGTKYALPEFGYDKEGIYNVIVTFSMKNGQDDIVNGFLIEVKYIPTTADFLLGDFAAGAKDTIDNKYTTETSVSLDLIGTYIKRVDSIDIDVDVNRGDDPHIILLTDTMTATLTDNIKQALASWKYSDAGYYLFSVKAHVRGNQSSIVKSSWVKIDGQKPVIFENPIGKVLSEGDSIMLIVAATGTLPFSYKWYKTTGTNTSGAVLNPLIDAEKKDFSIGMVQLEDSGFYVCVVSNKFGEDTSSTAFLNVQPLPPDSNSPDVSFAVDTGSGMEGIGGSVKVILSKAYTNEIAVSIGTLSLTTADTGDYNIVNPILRFGVGETEKYLSFTTLDDIVPEQNEKILFYIKNVSRARVDTARSKYAYTIYDNDVEISFESSSTDVPENIGDTDVVHIWMNLSGPLNDTVTIEYTVSGGDAQGTDADYEVIGSVPQTIRLIPGDTRTDIKVKIIDDKKDENVEYFDLQIVSVTGANVRIGSMNTHKVKIYDDDIPYFYFDSLLITAQENIEKVFVPVRLSTASVNEIKVKYEITGGTASGSGVDYALSGSDTLLFKSGDTVQYIEVAIVKDAIDEDDETINMSLMSVDTSATPMAGSVSLAITIKDNTDEAIVVFSDSALQIPEEGNEVAIPVSLTGVSGKIASVSFQIKGESADWNNGDVTISGHTSGIGKLTFPIGTLTQNISVLPINDVLDDDSETFTITLFNPENCFIGSDSIITITIIDDDYRIVVQSAGNGTVVPDGDTIISRGGSLAISAAPAANYNFAGWQATPGLTFSSQFDAVSSLTGITTGGTVTAWFSMDTLTVSLVAGENGTAYAKGISSGDIRLPYGSILSFDSVKPSPNYHFKEWQVSDVSAIVIDSAANLTKPTATFRILARGTITPVFEINMFAVNIIPNNLLFGKTIPIGIQPVAYDGSINLTAEAAPNYHFIKWIATGGLSDVNILNLTSEISSVSGIMDSGTVTAIFGIDSFNVSLTTPDVNMGDVSFSQKSVPYGSDLQIIATNKTGYHFMKWIVTNGTLSVDNVNTSTATIKSISDSGTISAIFAIDTFSILVKSDGHGSVSPTEPTEGQKVVYRGSLTDVRVVSSEEGYQFKNWSLTNSAAAKILPSNDKDTIIIDSVTADNTVIAHFEMKQYTLTVNASDNDGIVSIAPGSTGKYNHGTAVSLSVVLQPGWKIDSWINATVTGTGASVTMTRDTTVIINVSPIPAPSNVICVKSDALQNGGGAIGSSWVDAFTDLNAALAVSEGKTVWVAKGTYKPHATLKDVPFTLKNNSRVIGGFAGNETSEIRDSLSNTTILSGLLTPTDTSLNIVNVPAGASNVLISTFTIENSSGGTAGTSSNGGINAINSNSLTVFRCVLKNNSPCAMEAGYKSTIRQCIFTANKGLAGAAIRTKADSLLVQHTVIADNESQNNGAGIFITGTGGAAIINSTIVNNRANSAGRSAGIWKGTSTDPTFMQNCIVWGNTVNGTTTIGTQINVTDTTFRSDIQDTATGVGIGTKLVITSDGWQGVLQADPQFVSTTNLIGNDGKWFTDDDGLMLVNGSSPCIDAGRSIASHPSDWNSTVDIRGKIISKTSGKNYDMGAYDQ